MGLDKQDKVERGLYVFGQPIPFKQAFPTITDLYVTVEIRVGGQLDGNPEEMSYTLANPPGEYIRCPRHDCTDGGWCIGDRLREMVAKGETEKDVGGICTGQERMNRRDFRKCLTLFNAKIKLTYKP